MKRLLFLLALAASIGGSALAFETGDYLYTPVAKFKVTGGNLIANGNFSNLTEGWTNLEGGDVNMVKWSIETGVKDGANAIKSLNIDGSTLARSIQLSPQKIYSISYDIKCPSAYTTSTKAGNTSYIGIYVNRDGSFNTAAEGYRLINEVAAVKPEWQTVSDTITTGDATEYLQIVFQNIDEETMITNVELHEVSSVYDDRIARRTLKVYNKMVTSEEFARYNESGQINGADDLKGAIQYVESALADPEQGDDPMQMADLMDQLAGVYTTFLDANTADVADQYNTFAKGAGLSKATNVACGDWWLTGTRWFHTAGANLINSSIQANYDLNANAELKTKLPAGRYLMSVDLKGTYNQKADRYVADYSRPFYGAYVYAQGDTVKCDTLSGRHYDTYVKFFDVTTDSLVLGFGFAQAPDQLNNKCGGGFTGANFMLRKLGTNASDVNRKAGIEAIQYQQYALRVMIDSAIAVMPKTEYMWGKEQLQDSINAGEQAYSASLTVIDAEGNVLDEDKLKDENEEYTAKPAYATELKNEMEKVRAGIRTCYALAAPYENLKAYIEESEAICNDQTLNGDAALKAALQSAIAEAKALVAQASKDVAPENFTEMQEKLKGAREKYVASTAGFDNPAELEIVNPFFDGSLSGWTASGYGFKAIADDNMENGTMANVSRGQSASPESKLVQTKQLTDCGLYEYRTLARGWNNYKAYDVLMATISQREGTEVTDTIYDKSEMQVFFGLEGRPDSVRFHSRNIKWLPDVTDANIPSEYSVFYYLPAGKTETVEFGIDTYGQVGRAGANTFGFGGNHIYFYGNDIANYLTYAKKALEDKVAEAKALAASVTEKQSSQRYLIDRVERDIIDAEAVLANLTTSTNDGAAVAKAATQLANVRWSIAAHNNDIAPETSGISSMLDGNNGKAAHGIYTLTGIKLNCKTSELPRGLYIINGKKWMKQ